MLFHDSYSFEKFEVNQLPYLKKSLKFYKEQLKFSDKALVFFEHCNPPAGARAGIKTDYNQLKLKYSIFSIDNLKNNFTNFDLTKIISISSLYLYLERMNRKAIFLFQYKNERFNKD